MIEFTSRTIRVLAVLLAAVGAIDAVRGPHWDQFAMLAAIAVLVMGDLLIDAVRPSVVDVRADHLAWLAEEAARTDDTVPLITGRAIAAYRATHRPPPGREAAGEP